jgi:hypothetical protein
MLKSVYLYNLSVGGKDYPTLYESLDFGSSTFNSFKNSLVEMARQFTFIMGHEFEETPVRNHAPPDLAAWLDTSPLSNSQIRQFKQALPSRVKLELIDERETEEYKKLFDYFKGIGKKSSKSK